MKRSGNEYPVDNGAILRDNGLPALVLFWSLDGTSFVTWVLPLSRALVQSPQGCRLLYGRGLFQEAYEKNQRRLGQSCPERMWCATEGFTGNYTLSNKSLCNAV